MKSSKLTSLVLIVVIIALLCGWYLDRLRLNRAISEERKRGAMSAVSVEDRLKAIRDITDSEETDVPLLLYALSDPDLRVRRKALEALQKIPFSEFSTNGERPDDEAAKEFRKWLGYDNHVESTFSQRAQFHRNMAEIRNGDSQKRVKELLGEPDEIRREDDSKPYHPYDRVAWCYGVEDNDPLATLGTVFIRGEVVLFVAGRYGNPPSPTVIGEKELRKAMQFLDPGPEHAGYNDPLHLIRVANYLQPLGKEKTLAIIGEYSRIHRGDETWLFLLLRTLFDVPESPGHMPDMLIGKMYPSQPKDKLSIPRFPIVIVDDIPFSLLTGISLGGQPQPVSEHVDYFREHGTIRATQLLPPDDPYPSFKRLLQSDEWKKLEKPDDDPLRPNLEGAMLIQVLALGRTVFNIPEARQPRAHVKVTDYDWYHENFLQSSARWDVDLQVYVLPGGEHFDVGHLTNIYK